MTFNGKPSLSLMWWSRDTVFVKYTEGQGSNPDRDRLKSLHVKQQVGTVPLPNAQLQV